MNVVHELVPATFSPALLSAVAGGPGAVAGAVVRLLLTRPANPLGSRLPPAAAADSSWVAGEGVAGLATYAAASGAITFISSRAQRSNPVSPSVAHFLGAGATSRIGLLVAVTAMRLR